jgi:NTP pyrophosphatase (non-canonical NTP hydrolase)
MTELPDNPTLLQLQDHVMAFCAEHGWDKKPITEVFLLLNEEIGEVAKHEIAMELSDVLNYLLEIASRYGIDLEQAYREKHRRNSNRKWNY